MKHTVRFFIPALTLALMVFASCTKEYTVPIVTTNPSVQILSSSSATCQGTITDDGGLEITESGICWGTSYYSTADHRQQSGNANNNISVTLTGLSAGQTYYYRAYAKNKLGESYGDIQQFTMPTPSSPSVTTGTYSLSYYGGTATASCQGTATTPSEAPITQAGICYRSGSGTPTLSNTVRYAAGVSGQTNASYSCQLANLSAGTYSYRAFATNSTGTSYGATRTFTVSSGGGSGTGTYTITFNGSSWNAAATRFVDYTSQGYMTVFAWKNSSDANSGINPTTDVLVYGWLESSSGSYTYSNTYDYMNYRDPNQAVVVPNTVILSNNDTIEEGTYYRYFANPTTFTENITAIDFNSLTISATWSEQIFDIEQYINNNGTSYGTMYNLSGTLSNYHFTLSAPSKKAIEPDNGIKTHHPKPLKKQ